LPVPSLRAVGAAHRRARGAPALGYSGQVGACAVGGAHARAPAVAVRSLGESWRRASSHPPGLAAATPAATAGPLCDRSRLCDRRGGCALARRGLARGSSHPRGLAAATAGPLRDGSRLCDRRGDCALERRGSAAGEFAPARAGRGTGAAGGRHRRRHGGPEPEPHRRCGSTNPGGGPLRDGSRLCDRRGDCALARRGLAAGQFAPARAGRGNGHGNGRARTATEVG